MFEKDVIVYTPQVTETIENPTLLEGFKQLFTHTDPMSVSMNVSISYKDGFPASVGSPEVKCQLPLQLTFRHK